MEVISPISLSCLNVKELSRTGNTLISILEPLMVDEYIARQVHQISEAMNILMEIKSTPQGSELTDEIHEVDHDVDELLPICEDDLKSSISKKRFFPAKGEAAERLLKLFDMRDRRTLMHGGYTDQGNEIRILFKDLFSPEYDADRLASEASPIFDTLKERFEKLSELLEARLNEGNLPSTQKEQKGILRYRIETLLTYLDSNIYDEITGFDAVSTPVNELVKDIMAEYKARITRKMNQAQES